MCGQGLDVQKTKSLVPGTAEGVWGEAPTPESDRAGPHAGCAADHLGTVGKLSGLCALTCKARRPHWTVSLHPVVLPIKSSKSLNEIIHGKCSVQSLEQYLLNTL